MKHNDNSFLQWFGQRLAKAGLQRAFGVPGGGTSLDLMQALHDQGVDTVITAREDAAVIMAGVSGILSEGPGVAFTTRGPGLASALNGLASAALDRMPALVISEDFDKQDRAWLSHQYMAQSDLVEPLLWEGHGRELTAQPQDLDDWLASGGDSTLPGPAVIFQRSTEFNRPVSPPETAHGEPDIADMPELAEAARLLAAASHPVVIVGLDATRSNLAPALRKLVADLGAPAFCTYMASGCIAHDDPHYAGIFTGGYIEQACTKPLPAKAGRFGEVTDLKSVFSRSACSACK